MDYKRRLGKIFTFLLRLTRLWSSPVACPRFVSNSANLLITIKNLFSKSRKAMQPVNTLSAVCKDKNSMELQFSHQQGNHERPE